MGGFSYATRQISFASVSPNANVAAAGVVAIGSGEAEVRSVDGSRKMACHEEHHQGGSILFPANTNTVRLQVEFVQGYNLGRSGRQKEL